MMGKTFGLFPVVFAVATLAPLALFALAIWAGGLWAAAGLIYMTVLAARLDRIAAFGTGQADAPEAAEFPAADLLLVALACGAVLLMPATVWALTGSELALPAKTALFFGTGLWLGQVANATAHELIHRGNRWLFRLGAAVYCLLLFGHHTSAHRLVHHRHAASPGDPNTARAGEGYYRFFLRAWVGSFAKGWAAETELRARGKAGMHPYLVYVMAALACLGMGFAIAGIWGLMAWAALALHAQAQLMLSDYVQHYGLMRARRADGRLEPVGIAHSWNAPQWFSSAYMLNAPRHSDHHAHPARPYPALRLPAPEAAPRLPWSLPLACMIALAPPLWRRAIAPRLAAWRKPA
jgi:alkane 1-monooxygenase